MGPEIVKIIRFVHVNHMEHHTLQQRLSAKHKHLPTKSRTVKSQALGHRPRLSRLSTSPGQDTTAGSVARRGACRVPCRAWRVTCHALYEAEAGSSLGTSFSLERRLSCAALFFFFLGRGRAALGLGGGRPHGEAETLETLVGLGAPLYAPGSSQGGGGVGVAELGLERARSAEADGGGGGEYAAE